MRTLSVVGLILLGITDVTSAQQLTPDNYDQLVPAGKEADAIYGDFAVHNKAMKAVVAAAKSSRNANMTVRGVGGCLIDLATRNSESDQLSCFYPGRRKFPFTQARSEDNAVIVTSPGSDSRPQCEVRYEPVDEKSAVKITSTWTNTTASDWTLVLEDDLRIDGGKEDREFSRSGTTDLYFAHDIFWGQAYGILAEGYELRCNTSRREHLVRYAKDGEETVTIKPQQSFTFSRTVIVATNSPNVRAIASELNHGPEHHTVRLTFTDSSNAVVRDARLKLKSAANDLGTVVADKADGVVEFRVPAGQFSYSISTAGHSASDTPLNLEVQGTEEVATTINLPELHRGVVTAKIIDENGKPIPAKVEFIGGEDTNTPNWGPETAEFFVRNLAYTPSGTFEVPLAAGQYDVIVSHGPEYDAVFTKVNVSPGQTANLSAVVRRVVSTPGWVSSDFHSHSSPSGDNTGSQKGRVLNLAAEHIEFAPCTEHNRVSTYDHHIEALNLNNYVATVSGMELTGKPLPLNHQNVFPMVHTPRTQDGGGPVTDDSPETQIERIELWDDRSDKLIQQNHPDIGWLFYDKNGDGKPDTGFSRSFPFMDVMEIHPIDRILDLQKFDIRNNKAVNNNRMLNWLQLLNQGFRIYGVVNTDAHYNFHGSGWLRNWIQSSTDDPAKINSDEMVKASQQGRLIMSNGPYLEATFSAGNKTAVSGQDLVAKDGKVSVHVRVQCPNWFDIDRVFVLINGRASDEFTFTRKTNPDEFADDVLKFDRTLELSLKQDAHIVVATGHKTETLGDVFGPSGGRQHPAAVTNPVFIDVDGKGFSPTPDTLNYPLPVKFKKPE